MARKTREEAEQTRQLLLDTAEQLFSEKGVSKTTLADIAGAAGLTRGAVYWHFQNKLDLYRALLARIAAQFEAISGKLPEEARDDPALALWHHSLRVLNTVDENPQVHRILLILYMRSEHVGELAPIQDECVAHMHAARGALAAVLSLAIAAGQTLPDVEPDSAAQALQALHRGLLSHYLADDLGALRDCRPMLLCLYRGIFRPEIVEQLSNAG
ncbi:TetR family transcriptional regulator [Xenophilus sp. AP218F]|nr:TetR family transcriptional regulator [Chromobacterium sp. ASV5]OWY37212.1 TetR family transcriptional regulator [Xenophilus sp. AP218F]